MTENEEIRRLKKKIAELELRTREQLALCQLATLVFNDKPPRLDFVYLTTETPDNTLSGIDRAASISRQNRYYRAERRKITLIGIGGLVHPSCDHPDLTEEKMRNAGVFPGEIVRVNYEDAPVGPNGLHHTGTETAMEARFVLENNYKTVGLIAPPFHQLRSYMHLMTALYRAGSGRPSAAVFNCPGGHLDWWQSIVQLQGVIRGSRLGLLTREMENCIKYWRSGFLLPPSQILEYFVHRA